MTNTELCKVRTITTFISLDKDKNNWKKEIDNATNFCLNLAQEFANATYTTQSIRIVTNPFGEYLDTTSLESATQDLQYISGLLQAGNNSALRIRFAIGEAKITQEIQLLPELIKNFGDLCNVCVNVALDENDILDNDIIIESAKVVQSISKITPRGEGNFNFTVNFNCKPLIPYFPASYHHKKLGNCFVIGLETPDLLVSVLQKYNTESNAKNHNTKFNDYYQLMSNALQYHISAIDAIIKNTNFTHNFKFSGFDTSAAPSKNCAR